MAKEKRRNWLDKISRWILSALPEEKASAPQAPQQLAENPAPQKQLQPTQQLRSAELPQPANAEKMETENLQAQQAEQRFRPSPPQRETVASDDPPSASQPAAPVANTLNRAWKAFALAWTTAGLSDHYFLEREELEQTLAVLDRSFEEELIEWLFQLCTKPEALKDLAGIIERGQVKPTDNIDAIRAFAYVSIATSSSPRQTSSSIQADQSPVQQRRAWDAEQNDPKNALEAKREPLSPITSEQSIEDTITTQTKTAGGDYRYTEATTTTRKVLSKACIDDIPLEELGLSTLTYHRLKRAGISTLLDLASKSEESLLEIKNLGQKSIDEVKQALEPLGIYLPFNASELGEYSSSEDGSNHLSHDTNNNEDELNNLGLSTRVLNGLYQEGIVLISQLLRRSDQDILAAPRLGPSAINEIRTALERKGFSLRDEHAQISCRSDGDPSDSLSKTRISLTVNNEVDSVDDLGTLGLSTRVLNGLYRGSLFLISQLIENTEEDLLAFPNLGPTSVQEIKSALKARNLSLARKRATLSDVQVKDTTQDQHDMHELEDHWEQLLQQVQNKAVIYHPSFDALSKASTSCPNGPAHQHLSYILEILNGSLVLISNQLTSKYPNQQRAIQFSVDVLKNHISSQLLQRSADSALQWVNQINKSISPMQEKNWLVYLMRCNGATLAAIGEELIPSVSRERTRQMEAKITKLIGIKSVELADLSNDLQEIKRLAEEKEEILTWLERLCRLPILGDRRDANEAQSNLWDLICGMDLKQRHALLMKHKLSITDKESDYHFEYIVGQYGPVGAGYWREFDNLKQFILRHATALGEPDLMPKQTSFPSGVSGAVQSYGGQSKVARRIGLQYQGQLVGSDGGRRYWTEERLEQLLLDANQHHQHDPDLMPNYGDILEFFSNTEIREYQDKKPHSAIAALTRMGTLHWSEVAARFGKRFVSGESQKSVTLSYIKAFVRDLGEHLDSLSPSELFVLFQAQGINRGEKEKFSRTFDALVDAVQSGVVDKDELRSWANNNEVKSISELLELGAELKAESSTEEKEQKLLERRSKKLMQEFPQQDSDTEVQVADPPTLEPVKILKALDKAADIVENSGNDSDKVEFLKAKAAAKLWDACFKDEDKLIRKLKAFPAEADSYSQEVQQAFIEEYEGARALPIPEAYAFRDLRGNPRDPKLMQRLVAFRLERDFRLLNLSGTGTGKTLSAIYAALICGCQRLLISCPNGVIESWRRAFSSAFPAANLIIKPDGWEFGDLIDGVNVVIVNHERFQDRFAQQLLGFCVNYQADMIVIDEIHQSKRRSSDQSSQRRKLMNEFIRISSNINTDLRVLGLSATPVINNLYEGRSLLELICQAPIDNVEERIDLNSCMNLYQHFVVHGIRMNPGQLSRTNLVYQDIDATSLLPQIIWATKKGTYHDIEQLLVTPKLKSLDRCLVRGEKTVIFVTYIKNTLRPITNWLTQNHYTFSVYTGEEKEAQEEGFNDSLDEFIRGRTDVLVASVQCAGTGVDGLQTVCNRAVFFQLPWTSTEFEQAIGRLDRDGTDFDHINVYIPLTDVELPDGERWSWCRSKLDRIESKRDIAKAAVDGDIPDAATLISPSEASKYWLNWLEKLEQQSQTTSSSPS